MHKESIAVTKCYSINKLAILPAQSASRQLLSPASSQSHGSYSYQATSVSDELFVRFGADRQTRRQTPTKTIPVSSIASAQVIIMVYKCFVVVSDSALSFQCSTRTCREDRLMFLSSRTLLTAVCCDRSLPANDTSEL